MSNAERQARYRARRLQQSSPVVTRTRRPIDPRIKSAGRSRPQRWNDATNVLLALQAEYANWLMALPDSLRRTAMAEALEAIADLDLTALAEALEAIADLDLTALAEISPPRGYGRD